MCVYVYIYVFAYKNTLFPPKSKPNSENKNKPKHNFSLDSSLLPSSSLYRLEIPCIHIHVYSYMIFSLSLNPDYNYISIRSFLQFHSLIAKLTIEKGLIYMFEIEVSPFTTSFSPLFIFPTIYIYTHT